MDDYILVLSDTTPVKTGPWPECFTIFAAVEGDMLPFAGLVNEPNGWLEVEYEPEKYGWVNGADVVEVEKEEIKMATPNERRIKIRDKYRKYIGRNHYSQARRNYCTKKYKDGKYYSDCSSSVSYAYKEANESFGITNTCGMWTSKKFKDVPVVIKNGIIQNPEILEIGDILLFAGNDTSRKKYGYVGHVEMVGEISGKKIMLYGHGSGLAKKHEMNAYCKTRYNSKSSTPLKRKILIRVRRKIWDDEQPVEIPETGSFVKVRHGNYYVRIDAVKTASPITVVHEGDKIPYLGETKNGWYKVAVSGSIGWISNKAGDVVE